MRNSGAALRTAEIPIGDENRFDWALDNDGVWYRGRNPDGRPHLAYQAFDATPARLFDAAPTASGSNIAISPSGKRMLVARESEPAIDFFCFCAESRALGGVPISRAKPRCLAVSGLNRPENRTGRRR